MAIGTTVEFDGARLTGGGKSESQDARKSDIGARGERGGPEAVSGLPPFAARRVSRNGVRMSIRAVDDRPYRGDEDRGLVAALREALRVAGEEGAKREWLARRLGCGVDAIDAWVLPSRETRIPAEALFRLLGCLPPKAAGVLRSAIVGMAKGGRGGADLSRAALAAGAEVGEMHRAVMESMADGRLSPEEARRIRLEAWEAEDAAHGVAEAAQRALRDGSADGPGHDLA